MKIITISREFGSGGRELGKRLADRMNIPCYDHEIIDMVAEKHGFDKNYVAHISEKDIRNFYQSTIGHRFMIYQQPMVHQPIKVALPKDLTKVKNKVAFNLTKRQLICIGIGAAMGIPSYFLLRNMMGNSNAATVMVLLMLQKEFLNSIPGFRDNSYVQNAISRVEKYMTEKHPSVDNSLNSKDKGEKSKKTKDEKELNSPVKQPPKKKRGEMSL